MSFIGIIASEKQVNEIKRIILKQDKKRELQLIAINSKSIENIANIKFETIIIMETIEKLYNKMENIRKIISKAEYLVINSDIDIKKEIIEDIETKIITYGLKQKSTITASSIKEDNIIICIQREIRNIQNQIIEPNEIKIRVENSKNINEILAICSIIMLYNDKISVDLLENFNFFKKN